jgi:hypothetical protein
VIRPFLKLTLCFQDALEKAIDLMNLIECFQGGYTIDEDRRLIHIIGLAHILTGGIMD